MDTSRLYLVSWLGLSGLLAAVMPALNGQSGEGHGFRRFAEGKQDYGIFTVTIENDVIGDTDRDYTSGLRVAKLLPLSVEPAWLVKTADVLHLGAPGNRRFELAMGQHIYTPRDTSREVPDFSDRPYAGWLYGSVGIVARHGNVVDQVELSLGVVGPMSLAEETQELVHRWIGSEQSLGWDYQLKNEATVQVYGQRNWWLLRGGEFAGMAWDVIPHAGGAIGNALIYSSGGLTVSAGSKRDGGYGVPRVGFLLPGNGFFIPEGGFSWQVFASLEGAYIERNIFLDENASPAVSPNVKRRSTAGEAQLGVQLVFGRNRVSYVQIRRSREFETQEEAETYGSLSYSYAF